MKTDNAPNIPNLSTLRKPEREVPPYTIWRVTTATHTHTINAHTTDLTTIPGSILFGWDTGETNPDGQPSIDLVGVVSLSGGAIVERAGQGDVVETS